ncbi:ACP S-malonyltransferase [Roseovarius nanhaiticus]|uniref:ACP S-malonyltransferase n=1 Tax=Roseovarius nanhaiticus TaxID=573024 RepID=UPI002491827B|nr:ACP S-malonyltransferase [Roseovarius nanhaiticus]
MSCRAVLICPGRGTYNKSELGYLARHHAGAPLLDAFDAMRRTAGQTPLSELDGAPRFDPQTHVTGDNASPLIYACSLLDRQALAEDIELVAVTGNSLGWYSALAAAGAVTPKGGFEIVGTMGRLMHERGAGGQIVYPCTGPDWRPDPARRVGLMRILQEIDGQDGILRLSIDLGGMLVLAGDDAGLAAFTEAVPQIDGRFPMRLPHHAAFHTDLMAPIAEAGRAALPRSLFRQPSLPMIDGRGAIWWPGGTDLAALHAYTLGAQVTQTYDFARAVRHAAREFAPDMFIIAGPGTTLGGSVAQSLITCDWRGLDGKASFQDRQEEAPLLVSMGDPAQREIAAG